MIKLSQLKATCKYENVVFTRGTQRANLSEVILATIKLRNKHFKKNFRVADNVVFHLPQVKLIPELLLLKRTFLVELCQPEDTLKAPAKRSHHVNATYRNIVGSNMLHAFGHHVAICWELLAQI